MSQEVEEEEGSSSEQTISARPACIIDLGYTRAELYTIDRVYDLLSF